ncbi:MAG: FecR protein [candidate division BRC1 bacterium ADurb.BinA364]|nr:MAG: FecR protein [candidate division BRC1 bacterium ADurb.BinA364]
MEAIPSLGGDAKLMRQIDAAMQEAAFAAKARASRRFGVLPHFTARQAIRIAAAALAIVLCSILVWRLRSQTARAEVAYGEVFVSTGEGIEQPLGPGERFRLPAWVRAGSEARLEIQPGPIAHLAANTRVRIESSREAAQMNGLARYAIRSNGRADGEEPAFTVITPLGRVDDLGTEFEIDLRESGIARIRVDQGMVRAQPNEGPSLDISAGRAARMGLRLAILENEPAD